VEIAASSGSSAYWSFANAQAMFARPWVFQLLRDKLDIACCESAASRGTLRYSSTAKDQAVVARSTGSKRGASAAARHDVAFMSGPWTMH